jgi:hypothetical protein
VYKDRGFSAAQQEEDWIEDNPLNVVRILTKCNLLPDRRPDLGKVQFGCHPALLERMEKWWSDKPHERPFFPDIVEFLKKLYEGRLYWGQGSEDARIVLPDGKEKEAVTAAFRRTLGSVRATVAKVERVQKKNLWDPFAAMRQTMLQRQGASDNYERSWLFHGTSEVSVDKIVAHGFNRIYGFKEVNKDANTFYGKGVYFAVTSKYSVDYTSANSRGERHMFMCRVLVGEYCLGRKDQPTPDVRRGTELFDSTVNNLTDPTIFVTYHDSQAYPEYLVTFTKQ